MIDLSPMDGHEKIALSFSGGKDSTAVLHLLREYLDRITVYHLDTGDLLPEMREAVERVRVTVPRFVRIEGDVSGWIAHNGIPSDLVSYASHPVGRAMGEEARPLISRYDCCYSNIMWPLFQRVYDDGMTLLLRGTKRADMPRLPAEPGETVTGVTLWYPLLDWTDADVFAYLRAEGVPLPRFYDYTSNPGDCARCSAWWSEGRGAYLKKFHPKLWADYDARLQVIIDAVAPSLALLRKEAGVT